MNTYTFTEKRFEGRAVKETIVLVNMTLDAALHNANERLERLQAKGWRFPVDGPRQTGNANPFWITGNARFNRADYAVVITVAKDAEDTNVTCRYMANEVPDGHYTVVTGDSHKTFRVKTIKQGNLKGRRVIGVMKGSFNEDYENFAFLNGQAIITWSRFLGEATDKLVELAWHIGVDPDATGKAYSLESGNCYRCNRRLTTPDSISLGIGPECAKKAA